RRASVRRVRDTERRRRALLQAVRRQAVKRTAAILVVLMASTLFAQMPDPKQMSGVPLPAADLPIGTVSVRVIRGTFNNVTGQPVEFDVNGKKQTVVTDSGGRAQVSGLARGTHVRAATLLDGQRIESQDVTIEGSGIRMMLVGV